MIFQNPQLLLLLIVLLPIVYFIRKGYRKAEYNLGIFNESNPGTSKRKSIVTVLSLALLSSLLIAASGPQRYLTTPQEQQSANYVFLIDVSRSMAARASCDESMRIEGAKSLMSRIITEIPMARFAITPFSELAFPFTELSFDRQYLLDVIQNNVLIEAVPIPGSDISNALLVIAEKKMVEPKIYEHVNTVILISDGDISEEDNEKLSSVIPELREAEIKVVSVGIGSDVGLPIPTLDDDRQCLPGVYERAGGREFYTHLVEKPLRMIAEDTGGRYFTESDSDDLVHFLRTNLSHIPGLEIPVMTQDLSHIFLIISTISLIGLAWIQRP